jgi:exopolysaccharide biosynthesis polyprenyl glycosylphosphotransferase
MIPRRFFWLFDLLMLGGAFLLTHAVVARLHPLIMPQSLARWPWLAAFGVLPPGVAGPFPSLAQLVWIFIVMTPATLLCLEAFGGYQPIIQQSRTRLILSSLLSPLAALSLVTLVSFAARVPGWSRSFTFSFTALSGLSLLAYRLAVRLYFARRLAAGYYAKNIVFIGLPAALEWMARYFHDNVSPAEYHVSGYLRVDAKQAAPALPLVGNPYPLEMPLLGDVLELGDLLIHRPIHEVVVIQSTGDGDWLQSIIRDCDYFQVTLRIVPEALLAGELRDLHILYRNEPLQLPAVVLKPRHLDSEALFIKRLMDIVVSGTLLVMLSPLFLLVAIAIKVTTPQLPVFYPWYVVGQKGKPFTGYKFTTMVADAEARKAELMSRNEMTGPVFKIKDDPRVTPLGRFLRKYSLNELPQLWSVLKGDMSLVGPRPAGPHELARYEFWHKRKLSIRPGITCLWQVRGRNEISNFDDWVKMDLEYIDNWSLWLDIKILAWTAWTVVAGTGS